MVKRLGLLMLAALVLLSAVRNTTAQSGMEKVRLGYVPVMIYAPLFIAAERGYFTAEGIEVELLPIQGGSDSVVQLAAGNFDVAVGGVGAGLLNAAHQGLEFKIVAPMHTERPPLASPLVISSKRVDEIKSVADLKGKKVSINATGAATEYWVYSALTKAGLTMNDITLTTVGFRDVPAALESGSVDASILGEPLVTLQKDAGVVSVLAEDFVDGITVTYLYMGLPILNDRPAVAEGFVRAYLKALRDLQGEGWLNPESAAIIEKYTNVPAAVALRANRPYYDPNGVVPAEDIEELQRYFLTRDVLEYTETQDITQFIDTSLVEKAVEALGEYTDPAATPEATKAP
ncbi:MAG TPA: ABC transporter substrate-binding protein [Aggregatilineales bacterium]|nr:ABC transporter substrate-binding protein [Anaerolineales bacterium]HRE48176.1 ABC transporter substrate-binding protein [Aggregatilineales bacterium]